MLAIYQPRLIGKMCLLATFLQNCITLLLARFMTFFKVKCPVSGAKNMLSQIYLKQMSVNLAMFLLHWLFCCSS